MKPRPNVMIDEPQQVLKEEGRDFSNKAKDLISITIMGFDFSNMADFRMAPSTLALTVQEDYAKQIGVPVSELVFIHEGRELGSLRATISEYQIEDGDFIKVKRKLSDNLNMKTKTETEQQTLNGDDLIVEAGNKITSTNSSEGKGEKTQRNNDEPPQKHDEIQQKTVEAHQKHDEQSRKNDKLQRVITLRGSDLTHAGEDPFVITLKQYADFTHLMEFQVSSSTQVQSVQESYAYRVNVPVSELIFEHDNRVMGVLGATLYEDKIHKGAFIKVKQNWLDNLDMTKEIETEKQTSKDEYKITETLNKKTDANKRHKIKGEIMTITVVDHREAINGTQFMYIYRVKSSTKFEKVVMSYAKSVEVSDTSRLSFLHEGRRLTSSTGETISECKIKDGNTIEVHGVY